MKIWHFVVAAIALWLIFSQGEDKKRSRSSSGDLGNYHTPYSYPSIPSRRLIPEIGEIDCTASNITTGNGPYTLTCEMEGDEIRINSPNGGFIIVDSDGYHNRTGHFWDVELE